MRAWYSAWADSRTGVRRGCRYRTDHRLAAMSSAYRHRSWVSQLFPVAQDDDVGVVAGDDVADAGRPRRGRPAGPWCACWRRGGQSDVTSATAAWALSGSTMALRPA